LVGKLGQGATSTVYLARAAAEGGFMRDFAIKVLHPHLDPALRARFLDEARLSARVRHPNIVSTVDLGADRGLDFLVLELVDGIDLRRLLLTKSVPLRPSQAAFVAAMVARGVHALHIATDERGAPLGAVHRDLSPHNIMIDRQGRPVLIDLGLAKLRERSEHTQIGVLCGRLPYMSPEQAQLLPVDPRSDVFSLGVVLFELLTGSLPFGDDDSRATLERLIACDGSGPIAALVAARPTGGALESGLVEIVATCLQREPADRFAGADELGDALEQLLAHAGADLAALQRELADMAAPLCDGTQALPRPVLPRSPVRPRRWRAAAAVATGAAIAAIAWFGIPRTELTPLPRDPADLASDRADVRSRAEEAPQVAPAPASVATPITVPIPITAPPIEPEIDAALAVDGDDAVPAPATGHAGARARRPKRPTALKPNPYATP
jgi:serine/threonine-protein kinase